MDAIDKFCENAQNDYLLKTRKKRGFQRIYDPSGILPFGIGVLLRKPVKNAVFELLALILE